MGQQDCRVIPQRTNIGALTWNRRKVLGFAEHPMHAALVAHNHLRPKIAHKLR